MKIRTAENLQTSLHEQLGWRKVELTMICTNIDNSSGAARNTALRSGVALLYAHWEGFIKGATNSYLEFISNRDLKLGDLQPNLAALAIHGKFTQAEKSSRIEFRKQIISLIRSEKSERANIVSKMAPSTRSNLNFDVFEEITATLGLDLSFYSTKKNLINETLVHQRNQIAHGEHILIDVERFKTLEQEVMGMMDTFAVQIQNAVAQESYLLSSFLV